MYPLGADNSGPTVRIRKIRDALAELVELDVVEGYRGPRGAALARYATSGRLRGLDGIYVESSTFLPSPADVAFLGLARALGIPVLTFIRDAYQLFPEYYEDSSLKRRIGRLAFLPAFRALMAVSARVAFPSRGLAAVFGREADGAVLPPGAPPPLDLPMRADARTILHVGALRWETLGGEALLAAVEKLREEGHEVGLTLVCRPGDEPTGSRPAWLRIERAAGEEIHRLLPDVMATVIPRRRSAYNDLAVPVKLMEYLSYGRPIVTTDCTETARIVGEAGAGVVVADDAAGLADGLRRVATMRAEERSKLGAAAEAAARANSWHARARQVLELLSRDR
jgi:glycosyltransferase involved in cell wall biosynthesis